MSRPTHKWDTSAVGRMKIEDTDPTPASAFPAIVDFQEAERFVEGLRKFELQEVGSSEWMEQHRRLEKLNLQAHQNAMSNSDEFVMEAFLTFGKLETLIHDLIVIETWKERVFPLLADELAGKNNMRLYFVLYHEATLVNLLEVFFYYKHVIEGAKDAMLDVVDYLARKLTRLNAYATKFRDLDLHKQNETRNAEEASEAAKALAETLARRSPREELEEHYWEIEFRVCVTAVALARFVSEHAEVVPLGVRARITDTHDYLILMIPLLENPPWTRRLKNGKWQKLVDLKWQEVKPIDLLKVTQLEGQPWIGIYQLLAKEVFRERYALNSFRKGQLLRLRKYLNELLLDQLPFLADVQRYMDELTVTNVPDASATLGSESTFLFQQVAMLTESIVKGQDWPAVALWQRQNVFTMSDRDDRDLLRLAAVYADDAVDGVMEPVGTEEAV